MEEKTEISNLITVAVGVDLAEKLSYKATNSYGYRTNGTT